MPRCSPPNAPCRRCGSRLYSPLRVAAALGHATAPCLLVGGTADTLWDGDLARRLSQHVLEVDGANHGMLTPGPLTDSIAVLGRVIVAMEEFLDAIDWPDQAAS